MFVCIQGRIITFTLIFLMFTYSCEVVLMVLVVQYFLLLLLMGRALTRCPPAGRAHWLTQHYKVALRLLRRLQVRFIHRSCVLEPISEGIHSTLPSLSCLLPPPGRFLLLTMKERRLAQPLVARCKLVLVGDVQCGKTAMLQVLVKDCYPEVRGCCSNIWT